MTLPSNLSLKGLGDWAEDGGTPSNPPSDNQHINADMVDGKHFLEMQQLWQTYTDNNAGGGGGVVQSGYALFSGAGTTGITMTPPMPNVNYHVVVIPAASYATAGYLGEWGVEQAKTVNNFWVYNTGSAQTGFRWFAFEA